MNPDETLKELRALLSQNLNSDEEYLLLVFNKNMTPSLDLGILEQFDLHINCLKQKNNKIKTIKLFLDCPGGDGSIVPHIVEKLRSNFNSYTVFVLEQATSAATMLCYGGDEIYLAPNAFFRTSWSYFYFVDIGRGLPVPIEAHKNYSNTSVPSSKSTDSFGNSLLESIRVSKSTFKFIRYWAGYEKIALLSGKQNQGNVINKLIRGFNSHNHKIFISEAIIIGLNILQNSSMQDLQCLYIKNFLISNFKFDQYIVFNSGLNENIGSMMVSAEGVSLIKHKVTQPNNIDAHFTRWEFSKL